MTAQPIVPPSGPAWRVTSQQESTQPGPAGTYTKGVNVTFITASGVTASVFVPNAQYNVATVQQMIAERAAALAAVDALQGD